ncbi:hypothetical protein K1719_019777 [Acacia pycnantha]|nr:hypothetical protein K1719_019777 [Acacia pycnantha]
MHTTLPPNPSSILSFRPAHTRPLLDLLIFIIPFPYFSTPISDLNDTERDRAETRDQIENGGDGGRDRESDRDGKESEEEIEEGSTDSHMYATLESFKKPSNNPSRGQSSKQGSRSEG